MATILVGDYLQSYDYQGKYHYAHDLRGRMVHVKDSADYTRDNSLTAVFLDSNPDLSDRPDLAEQPPEEQPPQVEEG